MTRSTALAVFAAVTALLAGCATPAHKADGRTTARSDAHAAEPCINETRADAENAVVVADNSKTPMVPTRKDSCTGTSMPADNLYDGTPFLGLFIDL